MPMSCPESPQRPLATEGPSWSLPEWPWMPEDVRQQMEADAGKPKAAERLYGLDGRLVVAPGGVLPDNHEDLLTEDQVLGRAPIEPGTRHRRRVRKAKRNAG